MSKQREALELALEALDSDNPDIMLRASIAIREALAEPELEFWPGDVLICKEDNIKVTVVHGNRGVVRLMNGKIAVAWDDNVGGEYTIEQIKEMFYQDEKPEPEQEPVAWVYQNANVDKEYLVWKRGNGGRNWRPLYTSPPTRKPLTDEEISVIVRKAAKGSAINRDGLTSHRIARAIERAHGIGD